MTYIVNLFNTFINSEIDLLSKAVVIFFILIGCLDIFIIPILVSHLKYIENKIEYMEYLSEQCMVGVDISHYMICGEDIEKQRNIIDDYNGLIISDEEAAKEE